MNCDLNMFILIFSFFLSVQVNGINVEKCTHEEVVSIWSALSFVILKWHWYRINQIPLKRSIHLYQQRVIRFSLYGLSCNWSITSRFITRRSRERERHSLTLAGFSPWSWQLFLTSPSGRQRTWLTKTGWPVTHERRWQKSSCRTETAQMRSVMRSSGASA